jgi:hypothetical protein
MGNCVEESSECDYDTCSGHGDCDDSGTTAVCDCYTGWDGLYCDRCALGYHLDGDNCVLDELCQADSCGPHGTCDDSSGEIVCECEAGYAGETCEECAAGYHEQGDQCLADTECLPNTCDQHGTCDDSSGQIICTCDTGYTGPHCDLCASGYHPDNLGNCVVNESCRPETCNHHGDCDDSDGEILCTCDEGYTGDYCSWCADGYHDDGTGQCLPDEDCDPAICNYHGSCEEIAGQVVCHCDQGYAGIHCELCAPGYHLEGDECYLDEHCLDNTCNHHGDCDDSSGQPVCDCDLTYTGPNCEECIAGFEFNDLGICVPIEPEDCTDGIDNDSDGQTDCQDTECLLIHPDCGDEDCQDTIDNDGDELTDCHDPDCAGQPACEVCSSANQVQCGSVVSGFTSGASLMNVYPPCSDWDETGPETVYRFEAASSMQVDAKLTNMSADLDIFVLAATCNPNTCTEQGSSEAFFVTSPGITYYIVVDGYEGDQGSFTLTVTCE